jgi:hypothetical protein
MCYVRAYLRARTDEQDATRARDQLKVFAAERGLEIVSTYIENRAEPSWHGRSYSGCSVMPTEATSCSSSRLTGSAVSPPATGRSSRPSWRQSTFGLSHWTCRRHG